MYRFRISLTTSFAEYNDNDKHNMLCAVIVQYSKIITYAFLYGNRLELHFPLSALYDAP